MCASASSSTRPSARRAWASSRPLLRDLNDEWAVQSRYMSLASLEALSDDAQSKPRPIATVLRPEPTHGLRPRPGFAARDLIRSHIHASRRLVRSVTADAERCPKSATLRDAQRDPGRQPFVPHASPKSLSLLLFWSLRPRQARQVDATRPSLAPVRSAARSILRAGAECVSATAARTASGSARALCHANAHLAGAESGVAADGGDPDARSAAPALRDWRISPDNHGCSLDNDQNPHLP
jgi:hypothetical protein